MLISYFLFSGGRGHLHMQLVSKRNMAALRKGALRNGAISQLLRSTNFVLCVCVFFFHFSSIDQAAGRIILQMFLFWNAQQMHSYLVKSYWSKIYSVLWRRRWRKKKTHIQINQDEDISVLWWCKTASKGFRFIAMHALL